MSYNQLDSQETYVQNLRKNIFCKYKEQRTKKTQKTQKMRREERIYFTRTCRKHQEKRHKHQFVHEI